MLAALLTLWLGVPALIAQNPGVVEEDLLEEDLLEDDRFDTFETGDSADPGTSDADSGPEDAFGGPPALDDDAVLTLFTEAEATFHSVDRPASLTQLTQLIDLFERHLADAQAAALDRAIHAPTADEMAEPGSPEGSTDDPLGIEDGAAPVDTVELPPLPPEVAFLNALQRRVFSRSLGARAILYHDFGEDDLATADLERLLQVEPSADLEGLEPGDGVAQDFANLVKRRIGRIAFAVEPLDATVTIDGREVTVPAGESQSTLAGEPQVVVQRPGYRPHVEPVNLRAGRERTLEITLERVAPVLRLVSRPPGATVLLDGEPVTVTSGTAAPDLLPNTGSYQAEEFSAESVLDDFELGLRVLEVRKEGFRPYRAELMIGELLDYPVPPIVLEAERGVLVFRDLPQGAEVRIDDQVRTLENPGSSLPRLTLPPGDYGITVTGGQAGMFSTQLFLADRQTLEVKVRLRPGVAFLGTLGADSRTAADLERSLRRVFDESSDWAFLDRTELGARVLAEAGATPAALLTEITGGDVEGRSIDWQQVQWSADQRAPGLVYLAIVVSESLVERKATLLVWSAAPGPAQPTAIDLPFGDATAYDALRQRFAHDLPLRRPWTGVLLLDSPSSPHPVVGAVTPGSPAEAAGIVPGDALVAISGVPIFSSRDVEQRLALSEIGEVLEVGLLGTAGARKLRLDLVASPWSLDLEDPDLIPAVAFNRLGLQREDLPAAERWILALDQGLLLLQAQDWQGAVRQLRDVDAPQTSHGFGKAAVDYWLGLALSQLGSEYRDAARLALEQAARLPEARLDHNDGPWVAPRALARLQLLGGGS